MGETCKRVLDAVRELGYAPNFGARALVAQQTNTVGAVIPTMENAVFARGLQAFQEELGRLGKTLLVASSAYNPALDEEQVRALVARGADGVLLIGYDRSPELYAFLAKRNVPVLVAWSFIEGHSIPAIGFDNRAAMAALARLVLQKGQRHITCISAPTDSNDRARGRVQGIWDAMEEAGLSAADLRTVEIPYGIQIGETAFRELLAVAPDTTAIMCVNDVLAFGALRAARDMGLRVPEDVSITGFDDIEIAALSEPPLTTVHLPHRDMGRTAATMLIQMLNEGPQGSKELPTDIRLRQSLAAPRSN